MADPVEEHGPRQGEADAVPQGDAAGPAIGIDEARKILTEAAKNDPELRKALKSDPLFAGIAGDIAEQRYQERVAKDRTEAAEKARQTQLEELKRKAREEPEEFAAEWLQNLDAEQARLKLLNLETSVRTADAAKLRTRVLNSPDFKEQSLTIEENMRIAHALVGVTDEDAQVAFNDVISEIRGDRRAAKRLAAELPAKVKEEIEAHDAELVGARMRATPAPEMRRGAPASDSDEPDFRREPQKWLAWDNARRGRR